MAQMIPEMLRTRLAILTCCSLVGSSVVENFACTPQTSNGIHRARG